MCLFARAPTASTHSAPPLLHKWSVPHTFVHMMVGRDNVRGVTGLDACLFPVAGSLWALTNDLTEKVGVQDGVAR